MTTKLPYRISNQSISVVLNGKMRVISSDSPNYDSLREELRKPAHDLEKITELADLKTFIAKKTFGEVVISDDSVFWRKIQLHGAIVDRMLNMLRDGDDLEPLALFLNKLMLNPDVGARNELYQWLEAGNAPICPDGDFLAFKRIRANYTDCHSGTMDNSPGKVVEMPRSEVDSDRNNHCSRGLHFCQHEYLRSFSGARTVIVKINPADVVSIPTDYKFQKGRAWRYLVVQEVSNNTNETADTFKGVNVDKVFTKAGDISLTAGANAEAQNHVPNAETEQAMSDAEQGKVETANSVPELMEKLEDPENDHGFEERKKEHAKTYAKIILNGEAPTSRKGKRLMKASVSLCDREMCFIAFENLTGRKMSRAAASRDFRDLKAGQFIDKLSDASASPAATPSPKKASVKKAVATKKPSSGKVFAPASGKNLTHNQIAKMVEKSSIRAVSRATGITRAKITKIVKG